MKPRQLAHWLTTFDPIHRGWTPAGIANGLCATSGFFFPRISGGYNLYRAGALGPGAHFEWVGAAAADAQTIQTFPWVTHAPNGVYVYRVVPVGGGGVENWTDPVQTTVRFTDAATWAGLLPNAPTDLHVVPLAYGRFAVRWSYCPQGEQTAPAGFSVYKSTDSAHIDYSSIEFDVPYRPGRPHYEVVTLPKPDGTRTRWAVRAYAASGREEENLDHVVAVARAAGPPADPAVRITLV